MSKRLEDFVRDNREAFDELEPSADLWANIEKHLPRQFSDQPKREAKTFSLGFVLRVAASVVIVMGIGFAIYLHKTGGKKQAVDLAAINPVYAEQQVHYSSLIESKRSKLKSIAKSDPVLYKKFSDEIARMDSTYKKLNSQLPTSPNQELVLRAMIHNLEIQAMVLNQQLKVIEQFNEMKNEQNNDSSNI